MSESTLEAPPIRAQAPPAAARLGEPQPWTLRLFMREHPAWATAIALVVLSGVIVLLARTRPSFDAYGWLVWGHQTLTGTLNTNAAPSWKPLPYLFTVPYAALGHYELWLWMLTAVAISLSGAIFAGRIAYRLIGGGPRRRYGALAASLFAALALLGIRDYWHYILSAQSDPMIVALCLGAIDCHLSRRPRWAFVLGTLASLGRPEVWLFLGLYSIWAWRAVPAMRSLIVGGIAVLVVLWFGVPALSSRSAFVAGSNALGSGRALHSNKVLGTIDRFLDMHETPLELLALLSIAFAAWKRDKVMIVLALGALAWVVVEAAFSLHGWPGLPRYMFAAGAVMVVLAAVGIGRLLAQAPSVSRLGGWAGAAFAALVVASLIPAAISRAGVEHKDLRAQQRRTMVINQLASTITRFGGAARLRACGEPLTRLEYQTVLAWSLRVNVAAVGFKYGPAIASRRPIVLFTPTSAGWKVQALHQRLAGCRTLPR